MVSSGLYSDDDDDLANRQLEVRNSGVRHVIGTALPLVIDNAIFYSSAFWDSFIVGSISTEALGAANQVNNARQFAVLSPSSLFYALQPLISELRNDSYRVNVLIRSATVLSGVLSLGIIPVLLVSPELFALFGEPNKDMIWSYFSLFVISVPAKLFIQVVNQFLLDNRL